MERTISSSLTAATSPSSWLLRLARCRPAQEVSDTCNGLAALTLRQDLSSCATGVAGEGFATTLSGNWVGVATSAGLVGERLARPSFGSPCCTSCNVGGAGTGECERDVEEAEASDEESLPEPSLVLNVEAETTAQSFSARRSFEGSEAAVASPSLLVRAKHGGTYSGAAARNARGCFTSELSA